VSRGWYPAPPRVLLARERELALGSRPWLMGVVNASPDSFSDGGRHTTLTAQARLAEQLLAAGADILDVGGESARTDVAPIGGEEEIERVVPLIELAAGELGALVSVDTYKPAVARAAIGAGAAIVNDVSGLSDVAMAQLCAQTGAALVITHTLAAPGRRLQAPDRYHDIVAEVGAFLRARVGVALAAGIRAEQLIVDPGPDFAKTPAQTVELLSRVSALHELQRPVLMAISRKDFIGALTRRAPRDRLAGTLAALAHGVACGAHVFRVHDVGAAVDFLTVSAALAGETGVAGDLALPEELRYDRLARSLR
jgi:dihydropteroate synthase